MDGLLGLNGYHWTLPHGTKLMKVDSLWWVPQELPGERNTEQIDVLEPEAHN